MLLLDLGIQRGRCWREVEGLGMGDEGVERGSGSELHPDIVKLATPSVLARECGVSFVLFKSKLLLFLCCDAFNCTLLSV